MIDELFRRNVRKKPDVETFPYSICQPVLARARMGEVAHGQRGGRRRWGEEVRKTMSPKVRRTKCCRHPGPGRRNSGTSDLYFMCNPADHEHRHNIITQEAFLRERAQEVILH